MTQIDPKTASALFRFQIDDHCPSKGEAYERANRAFSYNEKACSMVNRWALYSEPCIVVTFIGGMVTRYTWGQS